MLFTEVVTSAKQKVTYPYLCSVVFTASSWLVQVGGMPIGSRQVRIGKTLLLLVLLPAAGVEPTTS